MPVNNNPPASDPYAGVDFSKVDYSHVDWNAVFKQPAPSEPPAPAPAPAPAVTQAVPNPTAAMPDDSGAQSSVALPPMGSLFASPDAPAASPAGASSPGSASNNTDVKGPANSNAASAGPNDPKITLTNTTNVPRTYVIASNGAPDETTVVPPNSSSVLRPAQGWSGAITDNGGTRQELTMNKDFTTYDSDFEYSGNNSTLRPDSQFSKTTGESDFLGKINGSYAGLSPERKQAIFASGAVTTSTGTADGQVTGVHVSPDAKFQAYRDFITNDSQLNGYKFAKDDTNSITNTAEKVGQAFTITSS